MQIMGISSAMGTSGVQRTTRRLEVEKEGSGVLFAFVETMEDIKMSPAADPQQMKIKAAMQKASIIQHMNKALQAIAKHKQFLKSFANELASKDFGSKGDTQLLSYIQEVRAQMRAFVEMMVAYKTEQRRLSGYVAGLAEGFRADDVMTVDPQAEDLTTTEGIEKFLNSMRERIESLSSYEGFLETQKERLLVETDKWDLDIISAMKASGELNEAFAMHLASIASEQLLNGYDIHMNVDPVQQKSRIASLLNMN